MLQSIFVLILVTCLVRDSICLSFIDRDIPWRTSRVFIIFEILYNVSLITFGIIEPFTNFFTGCPLGIPTLFAFLLFISSLRNCILYAGLFNGNVKAVNTCTLLTFFIGMYMSCSYFMFISHS